ncbi:hypothetical protein [Parazoarcus communis]|uniref:Uncharacterized protein n=1 Tax=Parazoarcus communis SWub3 = DSM 12120 TaxID=1121029 RepID=A0A323V109_9RHOO|nr:hypothetical protein [Parazoarcus communis]NMG69167.1 hypothetical protein [Parazoarcus communis SWub3 = DSM 12120]PZA18414.1 hypothetical protein DNK49_02475 [Azoarcus communis] [Parazoarcus communis SWub3 = DSM 12120]
MRFPSEFNRVTFGLPVETFRVDAYIALEERLPVVTEFVLRLLHICGAVNISAFRNYFGFTDSEALAVLDSLVRQGLLEVLEEDVQLSRFAIERFEESGGDHPRFSKVELRSDTVTFDLISFTPLRHPANEAITDNPLKLETSDESISESAERARMAYRQRFPEVAALRGDLRDRSFGVYSVEDVESRRRTYIPIPVSFALDSDGQVQRQIDQTFERVAPPELVQFVNEQVTAAIPRTIALGGSELEEFIDTFDLPLLRQYLQGKKFDLFRYLTEVHVTRAVRYPVGIEAVFGNLYLQENRERIVARIKERRLGHRRHGPLLTSLAWLTPDDLLWGRGDAFSQTVLGFSTLLRGDGGADNLHVLSYAEQGQEQAVLSRFRVQGLTELHFSRPLPPDGMLMGGRLELMLYPAGFMAAVIHLPSPGNPGLWMPIGFLSATPKHLDLAQKLLRKAMGGRRYGRKARFSVKGAEASPMTFEDGLPFLNYCGLVGRKHDEAEPEES